MPLDVVIAGGTGFVGVAVARALVGRGDRVTIASRRAVRPAALPDAVRVATYDDLPAGCDAVVNLAGANLFGRRWNDAYKAELEASRVAFTEHLVARMAAMQPRPKVLVSASAIGLYGDQGDTVLTEDSPQRDAGFLGRTCQGWERAALAAEAHGARAVVLRIGIALARGGGALGKMELPFRLFVGGPIGSGRQWMSWIHRDDLVAMVLWALDEDGVRGIYNATAPHPATNLQLSRALARRLRRPCLLPVPKFALRLLFGEVAPHLSASARVLPARALAAGFAYRFADVDTALADLYP